MKFTNNAKAALEQSDSKAVMTEMTPELKEKFARVSGQVIDLLKANTSSPVEGYMVLQFCMHAFEDGYGIRGGVIVENDEPKN